MTIPSAVGGSEECSGGERVGFQFGERGADGVQRVVQFRGRADVVGRYVDEIGGGGQFQQLGVDLADLVDGGGEFGHQIAAPLLHSLDRCPYVGGVGHLPG